MNEQVEARQRAALMQRLDVRFTADDHAIVLRAAAAAGIKPSQFVRAAAVDAAEQRCTALAPSNGHPTSLRDADRVIILGAQRELRRVGVNLNQLTRLAHRGELDLQQLAPVVERLAEHIESFAQQLGALR